MTIQTAPLRVAAIAGLGLAASGCVTTYPTVKAGQPAAEVTFHKSYTGTRWGLSASQSYNMGADDFCDSVKTGALFSTATGPAKTLRIEPGKPFVLWATMYYSAVEGQLIRGGSCVNGARITPAQGRQYDIKQAFRYTDKYCFLIITDRATGQVVTEGVERVAANDCRVRARR